MYKLEIEEKVEVKKRKLIPKTLKNYVGIKIKLLRKERNINQTELAMACNLGRTSISNIEKGTQELSITVLEGICKKLGVKSSDIIPF